MNFFTSPKSIDYVALDWSKDDFRLAMMTGRSTAWIRKKRKELGHPQVKEEPLLNRFRRNYAQTENE